MSLRAVICAGLVLSAPAGLAQSPGPKSAIPWLQEMLIRPAQSATSGTAGSVAVPDVSVTPLSAARDPGIGVLPPDQSAMPRDIWTGISALRASRLIAQTRHEGVPAARALFRRLLLAQVAAPIAEGANDTFLLSRVDRLIEIGALEEASALIESAGHDSSAPLFRRYLDLAILSGRSNDACGQWRNRPFDLGRMVEIYCLAVTGSWEPASLTLDLAERLGDLTREEADLLAIFLEIDQSRERRPPPPRSDLTALEFALREASGMPRPPALPPALMTVDLGPDTPLRQRMEIAEALVREHGLTAAPLFAAYRAGIPAASGGIWERERAVQDMDRAVLPADIAAALAALDAQFAPLGLRGMVAREYAGLIATLTPGETEAEHASLIATYLLLAGQTTRAALWLAETPDMSRRLGPAFSAATGVPHPKTGLKVREQAILAALAAPLPAPKAGGTAQTGEMILRALRLLAPGSETAPNALRDGLTLLRAAGLDSDARQIAVEMLLLTAEL